VSDDRLVRDALAGQQDAYTALLQRYERQVFSVIVRLVQDPGVAEELAQETFLKAFRRLDSFDQRRGFSAWLLRIAHNTAVDALRRRGPQTLGIDAGPEGNSPAVASSEPGPARRTEQRFLVRDLAAALARLRAEHRLALMLRVQEAESYQQIAYVMGVSESTAKSYVHRARRRLSDEMRTAGWGSATDRTGLRSTK
jgi:RNA polymerase sigma-70 factor (ECF subfamily)